MNQPSRPLFHRLGAVLSLALSLGAALLVCSVLAVWLWLQSEGSLRQALQLAAAVLPAGQSLHSDGVSGTLRDGGHLGQLLWTKNGLRVELQDLDLAWDWHAALNGELRLSTLHARLLRVDDRSPASTTPLTEWHLPLRVDLQFALDRLEWAGPPVLQAEQLHGHYRYDGTQHWLQDAAMQMADGSYRLSGQLQASQPMALALQLDGNVQTPVYIRQAALNLQAQGTAKGTLSGLDASVDVALALQPQGEGKSRPLGAMQASLQARLRPGQPQPVANAQAQWSALNLASLWPQAPHTSLAGQARVLPDGSGWKGDVQLQNSQAGTLDQQRLPLRSASASLLYRNGAWLLSALQADVAGGTLQAQGRFAGSPQQWALQGTLQGIDPVQVDTRWHYPVLHGSVAAQQSAQGIAFDTQLSAPLQGSAAGSQGLLSAKGRWSTPLLQLDTVQLQTPQAQIAGKLLLNTETYASTVHLQATLPGAQAVVDGDIGSAAGQGKSSWQVRDAHALLQWLGSLPGLAGHAALPDAQGALDVSASWSGGWQRLGEALQVQATLQSPRLDIDDRYHLRELQLDLNGTLRALALQLRGKAQLGTTQLAWQLQSHGGQIAAGQWHGLLDALQLSAGTAQTGKPWTLALQQPVPLDWQTGALAQSFTLAAGQVQLAGPAAGVAQLQWQPVQWSRAGASGAARWSSKGQLQGLPLGWLELLGQTRLANLGLRGDLLFGGQWDAASDAASGLRLRAGLQRSSGDLQLLAADPSGTALAAGLRDAHVTLELENNALRTNLVWASDAGGNVQGDFQTRLQTRDGAAVWGPDAPLQARLHASLPRVGAWSLVAPVGWRIQGTLDADAVLSGTRAVPSWKGNLEAHDMAVRSVVDGIDFSQGVMRLQVNGLHTDIAELTLLGAGGAAGGKLQITGSADWLPAAAGTAPAKRVRLALEARAQAFRVSARPDQRLVVSGNLNARLQDARLVVRGALVADQALFVLPEDTAPRLGSDVLVLRPKTAAVGAQRVDAPPAPVQSLAVVPDISLTLDPGSNFQLQGHGLNTRLAGLLTLKAEGANATPRLTGELHTVNGTYRAYGQRLNIEEGTLRFGGVYDNPALDIRALRPNLQQVVGVQISGTAQLPVVRLYSDPDLPDADKLSWLVLGKASSNGGAEAAMLQQAALALLAGNGKTPADGLINAFGLDEVSLGQTATTNLDGSSGTEATVKLGKRISRDFYVAYERGLSGALGTFYVFYDLSRRLTLRGESGEQNAVDLIFTSRFD